MDLAYHFDYDLVGFEDVLPVVKRIDKLLRVWEKRYYSQMVELSYERGPGFVRIIDERNGTRRESVLTDYEKHVFLFCDKITSLEELETILGKVLNRYVPKHEVLHALEALSDKGLIVSELGKYLALAVPRNESFQTTNQVHLEMLIPISS